MSCHDDWLGYLVSVFVNETLTHSQECCPGCHDGKNSPLLHVHHQSGLLEKLTMFHSLVRDTMLKKMKNLLEDYISRFPDAKQYDEVDQKTLKSYGRDFLNQSSPRFIYYSHYLTPAVDSLMDTMPKTHIKPVTPKRAAEKMSKIKQPSKKKSKLNEDCNTKAI